MIQNQTKQHNFHSDHHCHRWVYYAVLLKYSFNVCVILFDFYSNHYKVYIHIPHIITKWWTKAPFNINHVVSSSDLQMPRLYQGWADCCEEDCNLDIIRLLQPSYKIHYCNQSVLVIYQTWTYLFELLRFLISFQGSALVQFFYITC